MISFPLPPKWFRWRASTSQVTAVDLTYLMAKLHTAHDLPSLEQTWPCTGDNQKIKGKTAFVAGATGGVGGQIVRYLRSSGVKVRALVRDYTKAVRQPLAATS